MTTIVFDQQNMILTVEGIDKLLSFKGSITIPLAHVANVKLNTEPLMDFKHAAFGVGTIFAGRIQAGSFKEAGEKSFWDVRDPKKAILISLKDEKYSKLIVEVEKPEETIRAIEAHL